MQTCQCQACTACCISRPQAWRFDAVQSLVALKDFMLLLILFIFIFIVLGTQLFGGNSYYTPANTGTWRKGFATFYESFYTV